MASEFVFRLKDGVNAMVKVSVWLPADASDAPLRTCEIENYLGGYLAGAAPLLLKGELVSARASDLRLPGIED